MGEEFDTDQLVEFCQRLGLAKDGYLDEKELAIVCNCIGLQAPEEMMKELFEELDTDKDGRVCLDELSQMLRGMPKNPPSPEKLKKFSDAAALSSSPLLGTSSLLENATRTDFFNIAIGDRDRGAFSILDPQNSGFTKVGMVLDFWSQLGIIQEDGIRILKDMGFPANSRLHSLNVQDLTKALEDEADNSKDALPLVVQTALITYRTEAQYLRSICESMECERDKLKSDVYEAHQRSTVLAQEVDEQNARLEKNSQILLRKMEAKYTEQIHELQIKFSLEKDTLQQALQLAETQLKSLHEDDTRLKQQLTSLNNENSALERELQSLNQEIRSLNRTKSNLEKEISRYVDLENRLVEMERRSADTTANNEGKLIKAYGEMQLLRDQNDELSTQLEGMKETVKVLKSSQDKRSFTNKKRKGSRAASNANGYENMEECNDSPLEKIGKFNRSFEINILPDDSEELESSIDPLLTSSCSQPDSGNFPVPVAISLAACMGESSTDSPTYTEDVKKFFPNEKLDSEYKALEIEMDTVKDKIVTIITEKEQLIEENRCLKNELGCRHPEERESVNLKSVIEVDMEEASLRENISTQTVFDEHNCQQVVENSNDDKDLTEKLRSRITELENQAIQSKAEFERETNELKEQCSDLENSLDLLRVEYEKCEDYWQDKLREARELYEDDRSAMDEKFHDLAMKINEYEDAFLPMQFNERLPPIEERESLERQVTDLEDECEGLRKELHSVKVEQDSIVTNYQRQWETKVMEECGRLELQVGALSQKCKDYESRLSSLAEEERSTLEESGMMDMLKDHVRQLEFQLKNQEDKYKYQIAQLERTCRDKDDQLRRTTPEVPKTASPSPQPMQVWKDVGDSKEKSKSLLEMLQSKVEPMSIWPQRYANSVDKSSSLPFIPVSDQPYTYNTGGWGMISPNYNYQQDLWTPPGSTQGKKAWCHVELGWLQTLRQKLKQRDEQCYALQRALQQKEMETDKIFTELRYKHDSEISNWENLMHASQELVRQQAIKHKEQAEKLAHSDLLMKDLWVENSKLMAALNATEQRVLHLESLLKYQMNNSGNNNNNHPHTSHSHGQNQMPTSPRSLQHPPRHFST